VEAYEKRRRDFLKDLNKKVEEQDFALVSVQGDTMQRPQLMPIVDDEPMPIHNLGEMVKKAVFLRMNTKISRKNSRN
jgi:hypothetical protein